MSAFPEEVLTKTKKGDIEVRWLVDEGHYVRYKYVNPETHEDKEGSKTKLVLIADGGNQEEFFVIPTKGGRYLLIKAQTKGVRKLWDGEKAVGL